jgi:membrane-bound lytic murein transglycosylase A
MLCGCVKSPPTSPTSLLEPVHFDQIRGWGDDELEQSLTGFRAECARLAQLPADTVIGGEGLAAETGGRSGQWAPACRAADNVTPNDRISAQRFYETWFQAYRLNDSGLFTGYYEPEVSGSLSPIDGYSVPILARPDDLVTGPPDPARPGIQPAIGRFVDGKFQPYWTRADIEAGAMGSAARPLLWLHSQSDLFFLQIQGSGRIRLPDGSVVRVTYAGKNGRQYTPIGAVLVEQHALSAGNVNMQSIKAWLAANPSEAKAVMDRNADYVFFRLMPDRDAGEGPPGSLGVALAAGRSAAVDPRYVPLGAPIFVDTRDTLSGAPWRRLLLAQDSGTDIKGPARADIFFGFGAQAELMAGRMREAGTEYLLLPKPAR